ISRWSPLAMKNFGPNRGNAEAWNSIIKNSFLSVCLLIASQIGFESRAKADEQGRNKPVNAELPQELTPKLFTLQQKDVPLSKALAELAKQTGNQIEDRRQVKDEMPIKLELKNASFWQSLDVIAKAADAGISLYEKDGKIALVDGPYKLMPISYSGLFR